MNTINSYHSTRFKTSMPSEIHPAFKVRALFVSDEIIQPIPPATKTKVLLAFAVDSINKLASKKTHLPAETVALIGGSLTCKVDTSTYDLCRHLLKPDAELSLTVCPLAWKIDGGSGMFFDLIEVEKFGLDALD